MRGVYGLKFSPHIYVEKRWLYKVVKTRSRCDIQWEIYDGRYTTRLITGLLCYMVYCSNQMTRLYKCKKKLNF